MFSSFIPFYLLFETSGLTALFALDPSTWSIAFLLFVFTFSLFSVRVTLISAFFPEPGCSFASVSLVSVVSSLSSSISWGTLRTELGSAFLFLHAWTAAALADFSWSRRRLDGILRLRREVISFAYRSVVVGYWMIKTMPFFAAFFCLPCLLLLYRSRQLGHHPPPR